MEIEKPKGSLSVPVSIIIAGVIIAVAIVLTNLGSGGGGVARVDNDVTAGSRQQPGDSPALDIQPVTEDDHIRGDINAPITLVEFSDIECPFCSQFHTTMQRVVEEYDGQVAWVYRHFPLSNIHPGAMRKAEATECVAELSDNDTFWEFIDILFDEQTPTNNLVRVADRVGVDADDFEACLDDGRHNATVLADLEDAIAAGGQGTPHNILMIPGGDMLPLSGAQPFDVVQQVIETILEAS